MEMRQRLDFGGKQGAVEGLVDMDGDLYWIDCSAHGMRAMLW